MLGIRNWVGLLCAAIGSLVAGAASVTHAQGCDGQWLYGPEQNLAGTNGNIFATTEWDPDGMGPRPPVLIAGGTFGIAGSAFVSNIALWDGAAWKPLGLGVNGAVRALAVYHGELIAAGDFTNAGGVPASGIAAWNGESWRGLASGFTPVAGFHTVAALAVVGDELIVGGRFTAAGGVEAQNIARWNGAAWSAMGAGVGSPTYPAGTDSTPVMAISTYNGEIVIGGRFYLSGTTVASVARWTGAAWEMLGADPGPAGEVYALTQWNGDLIAGGTFGMLLDEPPLAIARWDGSWHSMGRQLQGGINHALPIVRSLMVRSGELYIAGDFLTYNYGGWSVARWDGANWAAVGGDGLGVETRSLCVFSGDLVAAGAVGSESRNVSAWDDVNWRTLGGGLGVPYTLCEYDGDVIGGGMFHATSQVATDSMGRWDGQAWRSFPGAEYDRVTRMLVHSGDLIATGFTYFYCQEGLSVGIGRWDGEVWHRFGGLGLPYVSRPLPLATLGADLIVGGEFDSISGVPMNNIARWDGAAWHEFGGGLPAGVTALCIFRGHLIAGGEFTSAGGQPARQIAEWDGAAWRALSGGLNAAPTSLIVYNDQLIAAGQFTMAGGVTAVGVARWDGAAWSGLAPSGLAIIGRVEALAVYNQELIVAGEFTKAGLTTPARNIARWDGQSWRALGTGLDNRVTGLCVHNGMLLVAGSFTKAGGQVSAFWARWALPGADFDHDGDAGTDTDIESFFACLAGTCCPSCGSVDFNNDGDVGTDADIESFFRVLGGGNC